MLTVLLVLDTISVTGPTSFTTPNTSDGNKTLLS